MRRLWAPSQMPMGWAGAGPVLAPSRRYQRPEKWTGGPGVHRRRMIVIASASASTFSAAVRRGPPMAAIASRK